MEGSPSLSNPSNVITTQRLKISTSRYLPQTLRDAGNSKDRLGHLPRLQMLPAWLDGIRGGFVLADDDDARDSRDGLCDALAGGRLGIGQRTPVTVFRIAIKMALGRDSR